MIKINLFHEIIPAYYLRDRKIEQKHIGEEIERLLIKGWDCEKISKWAESLLITFMDHNEIYKILDRLSLMSAQQFPLEKSKIVDIHSFLF